MDLNGILFPAPEYLVQTVEAHEGEIIFIPKKNKLNKNKDTNEYIPCLLLQSRPLKKISKNFLIFFHGNAEDIFLAREIADKIRANLSINILIVEYPGYGIYKEDKDSMKILEDCLTVFDFLTETLRIEEDNVYIFGRSIGTAPALYLSSKRKPSSLVLMSPFTSVRAVAQNMVGNLLKFFISERFTNIEYVKDVTCPILFIHGQEDTLIPFDHTIKLKDMCKCPYEVLLPEDMNHNQFDYENDLVFPFKDFLRRHTGFKSGEMCDIEIPSIYFDIPSHFKELINNLKNKTSKGTNISCFCVENVDANIISEDKDKNGYENLKSETIR